MTDTTVDEATGVPRARSPIVDTTDGGITTRLMVLGLAHEDGTVFGTELYPVAAQCGISVETVRSCMRRLATEGLFEREGEGRSAVFHATQGGMAVLEVDHQRALLAYAQDLAGRGWDRRWHLLAFAIPESQRTLRDSLRDHVLHLGGAQVHPGTYASPHGWEADIRAEAERLGITEHVSTWSTDDLSVGAVTDPRQIAAQLWDLSAVASLYEGFIESYRAVPQRLEAMRDRRERLTEADFLPGALHMAIRFNACFEHDPLLPPELLPRPWPGKEAREILARCRRLGVLNRSEKSGPALFRVFDDAIAHLP
ncbi:MAG: PaaX family transcriptional regulator C-terminal domain-containing protein [Microthrixaceae bacterium]